MNRVFHFLSHPNGRVRVIGKRHFWSKFFESDRDGSRFNFLKLLDEMRVRHVFISSLHPHSFALLVHPEDLKKIQNIQPEDFPPPQTSFNGMGYEELSASAQKWWVDGIPSYFLESGMFPTKTIDEQPGLTTK